MVKYSLLFEHKNCWILLIIYNVVIKCYTNISIYRCTCNNCQVIPTRAECLSCKKVSRVPGQERALETGMFHRINQVVSTRRLIRLQGIRWPSSQEMPLHSLSPDSTMVVWLPRKGHSCGHTSMSFCVVCKHLCLLSTTWLGMEEEAAFEGLHLLD